MTKKKTEKPVSFVRLEPILEILKAVIYTGYVKDERPVSLCLIAPPGAAKTECLKFYRGTPSLRFLSDCTSRGIMGYQKEIETEGLRHFVLTDLVRVLSHGKGVGERTIQTLATMVEEGESETADPGGRTTWKNFPTIGCLMGITPEFFEGRAGKWRKTGFLSRFLKIHFVYTTETISLIQDSIEEGGKLPLPRPIEPPNPRPVDVQLNNGHAARVRKTSDVVAQEQEVEEYPFRSQRQLRALSKGCALANGRHYVSQWDIDRVKVWSKFFYGETMAL